MFSLFPFLQRQQESETRYQKTQAGPAVPWTPDIQWKPTLHIQAASYRQYVRDLFVELQPSPRNHRVYTESPSGRFGYAKQILPKGGMLQTMYGRRRGAVFFDEDIEIPSLFEKRAWGGRSGGHWSDSPWMSITPMELFTLRAGTRAAKGHTIIAGLGLGHQLIEVSWKKTVKKITLIESSKELIMWLGPRIITHMNRAVRCEVISGDAFQIVPQLEADVALIDVFPNFGGNKKEWRGKTVKCPGIKKVWVWG